jgi:hypothetical protein
MKRYIIFILTLLFLSGCSVTGKTPAFPELPKVLSQPCPELYMVKQDETKLSEVLTVVTENYSLYHECSIKVDLLLQWHKEQKSIYSEIK